jgi:hypothetical protein
MAAAVGFIEEKNWKNFLDDFTKRNQFRATRLEVVGEVGDQVEEQYLPLVGVSFETKDAGAKSVVVILGGQTARDERHVEHRIEHVQNIAPIPGDVNFEEGLGFQDQEGGKTLLLFEKLQELPQ